MHEVVSDRLSYLQDKIRQDALTVIERCETEDELDFLFPEITRIHAHVLAVLDSWQNHVDWMQTLSSEDLKLLISSDFSSPEITGGSDTKSVTTALANPPEQLIYDNLKQKSHPSSLHDQLLFMSKPDLRRESELYISQQAAIAGHKTLVPSTLHQASDLAVANLYWYFKVRDTEEELNENDNI